MLATKTILVALVSAVYVSAFGSHNVASGLQGLQHRHLGQRLANGALAPAVSPRALHRRCKARHTVVPTTSSTPPPAPTPTEKKEEPKPAPKEEPKPAPKEEPKPAPKEEPKPKPQEPKPEPPKSGGGGGSAPNGFMAGTNHGQATFYSTGLGACGITNNDGDFIAAASQLLFDQYPGANGNPNQNPLCGKKVIANVDGKEITLAVTDRCEACAISDLDFSPGAFNSVADPGRGRIPFTWRWA